MFVTGRRDLDHHCVRVHNRQRAECKLDGGPSEQRHAFTVECSQWLLIIHLNAECMVQTVLYITLLFHFEESHAVAHCAHSHYGCSLSRFWQFAGKRFMNIGWSTGGPPMTNYVDAAPGLQITLICDSATVVRVRVDL